MEETPPLTPDCSIVPTRPIYADDESRWRAVQLRDAAADGAFIYCVRTTKIYCRPVCKARLARRSNVIFVSCIREAQKAGYRPCKRCKPDSGQRMPEEDAIRKIQDFLGQSGSFSQGAKAETLESMSKSVGLSKWHFHRVFKSVTGMTPVEYAKLSRDLGERFDNDMQYTQTLDWDDLLTPSLSTPLTLGDTIGRQWETSEGLEGQDQDLPWLDTSDILVSAIPSSTNTLGSQRVSEVHRPSLSEGQLVVWYEVKNTLMGPFLLVFQERHVRLVQQIPVGTDFREILQRSFPTPEYIHRGVDDRKDGIDILVRQKFNDITQLLEVPVELSSFRTNATEI